ncbi:hypothetical protein LUTEI9C_80335 [Luteimonas sp. 9C]|nr:hypothetical protein LUTEI9C_80335 [Luteimonas sp. 9C]
MAARHRKNSIEHTPLDIEDGAQVIQVPNRTVRAAHGAVRLRFHGESKPSQPML